ncbi:DUF1810 domain-containing protein [Rhodomicrobium lacus]|uniref:DUF1810 domain-containing protein n=1 Tax=Rhodomicrobium lacus TaxID=2498452 RepID=UPI00349F57B5
MLAKGDTLEIYLLRGKVGWFSPARSTPFEENPLAQPNKSGDRAAMAKIMTGKSPVTFDLRRFVDAQEHSYARAVAELRQGLKLTHWMWYIFPQLRGLGRSPMASRYGIASLDEARAYLGDEVLGSRLVACTQLVLDAGKPVNAILPSPDDLKFRSSMTLFEKAASSGEPIFAEAIDTLCDGEPDTATLRLLGNA